MITGNETPPESEIFINNNLTVADSKKNQNKKLMFVDIEHTDKELNLDAYYHQIEKDNIDDYSPTFNKALT